jgi:hypothetical protein
MTADDLRTYLETESDFAFEIRVIKALHKAGEVLHGGTYMDAVTGKPRQFDIRVTISREICVIRLAVECKNLKKAAPLLVSCLPRKADEAVHCVAMSIDLDHYIFSGSNQGEYPVRHGTPTVQTLRLKDEHSGMYRPAEPVGKTLAQIVRDKQGKIVGNDSEIYSKWSQALSSSDDLVAQCATDGESKAHHYCFSTVVPVLVVPDGTLWRCAFDLDGNRTAEPEEVRRVPYYVGKESNYGQMVSANGEYVISHLEIVTLSGLQVLLNELNKHKHLVHDTIGQQMEKQLEPRFGER